MSILLEYINEILLEGQKLDKKHFIGGGSGNPVVQKALDAGKMDTFEISRDTQGFIIPDGENPSEYMKSGGSEMVSIPGGTPVTLVTTLLSGIFKVGRTSYVIVTGDSGKLVAVPLTRVHHNMGHGGKKGVLSNQILGQAVEHAVAGGLSGAPLESIISDAVNDDRHSSSLINASPEDIQDFKMIMEMATNQVRPYQSMLSTTSARVDAAPTAKVDVVADSANGPIAVHVKYNDKARLFGLQQKMKKNDAGQRVSIGSESTRIYRDVRAAYYRRHLISAEAYMRDNPSPSEEAMGIIKRRGGTNDGSIQPVLYPEQFIANSSMESDSVTMLADPSHTFIKGLVKAGYAETLGEEVKDNLAPGSPVFYFKFFGGKQGLSLDVESFSLVGFTFFAKPTLNGKTSNAFSIDAVRGNQTIPDVLRIELRSAAQGHPPQVKVGSNYKKLLEL